VKSNSNTMQQYSHLSSYLPMDLVRLLLLDLLSGTTYLNICVILNFR